jgi:hypothetical protein
LPVQNGTLDDMKQEKSHRFPQFLPGGRAVVFNIVSADMTSFDEAYIAVLSLDTCDGSLCAVPFKRGSPGGVRAGELGC